MLFLGLNVLKQWTGAMRDLPALAEQKLYGEIIPHFQACLQAFYEAGEQEEELHA